MAKSARRILFILALLLGACSSTATETTSTNDEAVADDVEAEGADVEETTEEAESDELEEPEQAEEEVDVVEEESEEPDAEEEETEETEDVETEDVETEEADVVEQVADGTTVVTLLDEGAEPRQELRLTLEAGTQNTLTTTIQTMEQSLDGVAFPGSEVETVTETLVTFTPSASGVELVTEVTAARAGDSVAPEIAAGVNAELEALVGLTQNAVIDDRGNIAKSEIGAVDDPLVDQLLGDFSSISNPLPVEAVGVGGSWQTVFSLDTLGIPITQESTYTISEFTETGVIVDVSTVQVVDSIGEEISLSGIPAIIQSWDVSGEGTTEIDFGLALPVFSQISVGGVQVIEIIGEGTLEQTIGNEVIIENAG